MKRRRINSVNAIKRTRKRTRLSRSFHDDTQGIDLNITTSSPVVKKISSDGVKKQKKKSLQKPIVEKELIALETRKKRIHKQKISNIKKIIHFFKKHWFWLRHSISVGLVVLGMVLFFNTREQTTLTLRPHHEYLEIDTLITAHNNPKESQLGFDVMAIHDEVSIPIIAQGVRDVTTTSSGRITVFNNYSSEPQRLLPETRFVSASGKVFHLGKDEIIVPGKNDTRPGSVDVLVYASEIGPDYNIDITDFTLPGFKEAGLDDKYNGIYGVSTSRFIGGDIGTESYVTESQKTTAELELRELLQVRLQERLSGEITDDIFLIQETPTIRNHESEYLIDEEQGIELLTKKGSILALVISKEKLAEYIEHTLDDTYTDTPFNLVHMTNTNIQSQEKYIDFENINSLSLHIQGSPLIKFKIDEHKIKQSIQGESLENISHIFNNVSEVDRVHAIIRPFWKKKFSLHPENIHIKYE